MNSNSQWDRAQADWSQRSADRHRDQNATARYAVGHRRAMESQTPHWEAVPDDPMPDYDGGEAAAASD